MRDMEEAKDKIMLGAERKSMVMTEEDKKLAAVHEAGHTLVAKLTPGSPPINKVVIVPRGQTMGMVSFLAEERHSLTESKLKAHLTTAMGGSCAETVAFGERSTGAQADYKQVTALARSMVCDWGMSEDIGPLSLGGEEDEVFLGKEFTRTRNFSEQTARTIDREIHRLVVEAEQKATRLIEGNRGKLDAIADALLEYEVLDDEEIDLVMAGEQIVREPEPEPDPDPDTGSASAPEPAPSAAPGVAEPPPDGAAAEEGTSA